MVNAVIVYLEDDGDGRILVSVESIGKPTNSIALCNAVLEEVMSDPDTVYMHSSIFTRAANQVQ